MLFDFANVLLFALFAVVFAVFCLVLARLLGPRNPSVEKSSSYECGELPVGSPWIRFNPRYYVFALFFILFEVEIAFVLPCAVIFRESVEGGIGWLVFAEISVFLLILISALAYAWARGDLEWVKPVIPEPEEGRS